MLVANVNLYEKINALVTEIDLYANEGLMGNEREGLTNIKETVRQLRITINEGFILDPDTAA